MTRQIKSKEAIAGIPIMQVRDFFRHVVGCHAESFGLCWLQQRLSLDENSALALAGELVAQGYAEPVHDGEYAITDKGYELVRSSAAGMLSRKTAETALVGLLERVEQYNQDPDKILTVKAVVVFGSFLSKSEKLGDLDVAVKYRDRNLKDPDRAKTALAYATKSGHHFNRFVDQIFWASTELCQFLAAKKRTIKIQDWDSFIHLAAADPERVPYNVVFGSSEEVNADITARQQQTKAEEQDGPA